MSTLIDLAIEQKPDEFKTAIVAELNDRLRDALEVKREDMQEALVNKDDLTDKPYKGNVPPATPPKGNGGKSNGHKQTDEKKTGK